MIIQCVHCDGLMKIDEGRLPKGRSLKVRCPHCNEIGPVQEPVSLTGPVDSGRDTASLPRDVTFAAAKDARPAGQGPPFRSGEGGSFHHPTEQASAGPQKKRLSRGTRILLLVLGSLLVVGFFALLVNIILPGPYEGGAGTEMPPQAGTSARPVDKHRPSQ